MESLLAAKKVAVLVAEHWVACWAFFGVVCWAEKLDVSMADKTVALMENRMDLW